MTRCYTTSWDLTFGRSGSVPPVVAKTDRAKPEDRPSMQTPRGYGLGSFGPGFSFEKNQKRSGPNRWDGWHGDLAERSTGRHHRQDCCTAPYVCVKIWLRAE